MEKDKVSNKGPGNLDWRLPGCVLKCFLINLFCYLFRKLILIYVISREGAAKQSGAVQCPGAKGYLDNLPAGRRRRDTKLSEIGADKSEAQRMYIGHWTELPQVFRQIKED